MAAAVRPRAGDRDVRDRLSTMARQMPGCGGDAPAIVFYILFKGLTRREIRMAGIWGLSHKRAVECCKEQLEFSFGSAVIGLFVFSIYLFLIWHFIGAKESQQELELRLAWTAAPLLGFPLLYVFHFARSPRIIHGAAQDQIQALSARLVPRIAIELGRSTQGVSEVPTESFAGPGPTSKWVQLDISCATDVAISDCEVWLNSVRRVEGNEIGPELVEEHINCNWSQLSAINANIRPRVIQRVNLFSMYPAPVSFVGQGRYLVKPETTPMKIRLRDAIQSPGKYLIAITATAQDSPSESRQYLFEWLDFERVTLRLHS